MTMSLEVFRAAAAEISGLTAVTVERVRALKWLVAAPETQTTVNARYDGRDVVEVTIEGYGEALVRVAGGFPPAPEPSSPTLANERPAPVSTGSQLYADRWMFHGPAYQGIVSIDSLGDDGIRGVIEALPARGALLDAAGQLFGYWTMVTQEVDKLSMPVLIDSVELFKEPAPGQRYDCLVRIRQVGRHAVTADLELVQAGRVVVRIAGWQDWRFETDDRLWDVIRYPERNLLAEPIEGGCVVVDGTALSGRTREYLSRRFLSAAELGELGRQARARQADWLYGRIAAKDAVRRLLFDRGRPEIFPIEISVRSDGDGRPLVSGLVDGKIRVSIAHKNGVAVALAAVDGEPGVDIEEIASREEGFERLAFSPAELELLPSGDRDEWLTRLWTAKEAAAKASGTGFAGFPRDLLATAIDGERIIIENRLIETRRRGATIIAWTPA
jgi:phosphopantetheinyl transferase